MICFHDLPANSTLDVSIPADWVPALLGQGTGHMNVTDSNAFHAWKDDMRRDFGAMFLLDVEHRTAIDTMHEGTEYGMKPWTRCQTVTLAFA